MSISDAAAGTLLGQVDGRTADYTGHYHHNYRVITSEGESLLRRRRSDVYHGYDPRMMPEADALKAASATGAQVPEVFYADDQCLIEQFIGGTPPSLDSPADVTTWLPGLLEQVQRVQSRPFSRPPISTVHDWQIWLRDFFADLYANLPDHHAERLSELGLPPITEIWVPDQDQATRPLTLVHSDLTPSNLLLTDSGVWILDWELAMAGDPVWDAAVSLHRTPWPTSDSAAAARALWLDALDVHDTASLLDQYRSLEVWKSLIVDSARFVDVIEADPNRLDDRAERLHALVAAASESFGLSSLSLASSRSLLEGWASSRPSQ